MREELFYSFIFPPPERDRIAMSVSNQHPPYFKTYLIEDRKPRSLDPLSLTRSMEGNRGGKAMAVSCWPCWS